MDTDFNISDTGVIFGYKQCQTRDAKWLCIEKLYEKSNRPNMYDIGGTHIGDVPHYWFYYKTEIVGKVCLLHMFITSHNGGTITVSLSCNSDLTFKRKQQVAFLSPTLETHTFEKASEMSQKYLTTYSFSENDLEILKAMKLYIPVQFDCKAVISDWQSEVGVENESRALLHDPFGADFVIESADGVKFRVHRAFLRTHSEVFKAMLKENTAESQNSYLKMVDVDKDDLESVIEYIYTGTIENIENSNFLNLLMFSDRYNFSGLRELSECALSSQISLDNVFDILTVADLYNAENLKLSALKFIKCNNTAIHSSMFEEVSNAELVREICKFLVPN